MSHLQLIESKRHQPRGDLRDAFLDFMLSREAMLCTRCLCQSKMDPLAHRK